MYNSSLMILSIFIALTFDKVGHNSVKKVYAQLSNLIKTGLLVANVVMNKTEINELLDNNYVLQEVWYLQ